MTAKIIDGKKIATLLREELKTLNFAHLKAGKRAPGLAVILLGEDPASTVYVKKKQEACEEIGIKSYFHHLSSTTQEEQLIALITQLNQSPEIDGILLQLPLPPHLDADKIVESINPQKDVDGFHPYNLGRLTGRRPLLRPCTPYGIMFLLDHIQQIYKGKHAVIVGASNIVGRPMAAELLIAGATITICHRFTHDLAYFVKQADILVSAVGKPDLIQGHWIKDGATVIDVGITRLPNGSLTGDVQFSEAQKNAAWITPVPGGVGPMTVAILMRNTLIAAGLIPTK